MTVGDVVDAAETSSIADTLAETLRKLIRMNHNLTGEIIPH